MNISPGPRIIIRNEIALESLISRRARPALGIRARATSAEGDDCDFSRRESSPVRISPSPRFRGRDDGFGWRGNDSYQKGRKCSPDDGEAAVRRPRLAGNYRLLTRDLSDLFSRARIPDRDSR